jgi:hypothetical protein
MFIHLLYYQEEEENKQKHNTDSEKCHQQKHIMSI